MVLSTDENELGDKSVICLSKARWPCLSFLYLCQPCITVEGNKVSGQGWAFLSRASWMQLSTVHLCKIISTKNGTSVMRMRKSASS